MSSRKPEREHEWRDANGEIAFVHVKYKDGTWGYRHPATMGASCTEHEDTKAFKKDGRFWCPRKPASAAKLMWNMAALLEALNNGKVVHWCAGEKDADRLQEVLPRGEVATSVHQGEGKGGATPEQFSLFDGSDSDVRIYADKDNTGYKDALNRFDALGEDRALVLRSAVGNDVSDHFDAGKICKEFERVNIDKLRRLVDKARKRRTTANGRTSEARLEVFHAALREYGSKQGYGQDWACPHPDHDDEDPSFGVTVGATGKLVLNCQVCMPEKGTPEHKKWMREILDTLHLGWPDIGEPESNGARRVRLTRASEIKIRPVRWAWEDRIPRGEISLTPGMGGIGKSLFHCWVIAQVTRGTLPGCFYGEPRAALIATTEDSWEHTVAPRLTAAGADLGLVYRVDVITEQGSEVALSLPNDLVETEEQIRAVRAAVMSVDPLLGFLSAKLDSHKDAEVRQAMEPLRHLAYRTEIAILGNAHFNKSSGKSVADRIMASAAFNNLARSVMAFAADDDDTYVISQTKNNLGRLDLPSLRYEIESTYLDTEEGLADVGRLTMVGESERSVDDILRDDSRSAKGSDDESEDSEVVLWLVDLLKRADNSEVSSRDVLAAGREVGYSKDQLKRAKKKKHIVARKSGFSGGWVWWLPGQGSDNEGSARAGRDQEGAPPSRSSSSTRGNRRRSERSLRRNVFGAPDVIQT